MTSRRGDVVSYQNYVMARMPEIWGKDAAIFDPYRWLNENGESITYSPFSKYIRCTPQRLRIFSGIADNTLFQNIMRGMLGHAAVLDVH